MICNNSPERPTKSAAVRQETVITTQPTITRPSDEQVYLPITWEPSVAFLRYAIWAILGSTVLVGIAIYFFVPSLKDRALWPAPMGFVALLGWYLMRRGKTYAAMAALAVGMWVCVAGMVVWGGGNNAPAQYIFPLIIFMLGWLASSRVALAAAVITSAFTAGIVTLDAMGLLPAAPPSPPALLGLVQICVFLMAAVLVHALVRAYKRRLSELNAVNLDFVQRTRELQQSETKFATAFQSSPVAASIASLEDGRFVDANDKYERDFGWSRAQLIGRSTAEIGLWPDPAMREQWVEALKARGSIVDYETLWIHKDGTRHSISISGQIIVYDGNPCILAYVTDITQRKAAEKQIHSLAFFDPLTSLPNRRLLQNRLELALAAAQRHRRHGGLLFIDLDNFKSLNDTHGHDKGDLLLQLIAYRLGTCVREGDTVSRLGGDEFVVMLDDLSEDALVAASQAEAVAEKILANLDQDCQIENIHFHTTASIGVTLFGEQHEELTEPLRRADTAMYQAKGAGRNTIRFFDPHMQAAISALAQLEMELRTAVTQNQFLLLYQAQVNASGIVTGAETLVRWRHPQRGLVSPLEFIRVAEKTDLILPLGAWILEQACAQLASWSTNAQLAHLSVAVNVSARQFQQVDFVQQVLGVLQRTGANPGRLKLELTESMLIDNIAAVIEKMTALKAHGVTFSLDDFGTGYSSLSYLKQLPLDQLKIDQSFVHDVLVDPNDAAIARMVIVLAETLGLGVIAEGVETREQQDMLLDQGCQNFQGYFIGYPVAAADFETFVSTHAPDANRTG